MYDRLRRDLSYVQGLLEGVQNQANSSPESKALHRLVDVVDELVEAVQQLDLLHAELQEYVEAIDEDLNDMELDVYENEADETDDEMIEVVDEDEAGMVNVVCPDCGEEVMVEMDDLEDEEIEVLCPKCHTALVIEDITEADLADMDYNEEELDLQK